MCMKDIASTVRKSTMCKSREMLCLLTGEVLGDEASARLPHLPGLFQTPVTALF